jgi:hypothetical protein
MVIIGDKDTAVPYIGVKKYFINNKDFYVVSGADHFWSGFEYEIEKMTGEFFKKAL